MIRKDISARPNRSGMWKSGGVKNEKTEIKEDDPDHPTNDHGKLECARIAIDAQTGEIISIAGTYAPKQNKLHGIEDFQGYVSWDNTQGK